MDPAAAWKATLNELEVELGKNQFRLYFQNSQLLSLENNIGKIGFPNKMVADQTSSRYYALIQSILQKHTQTEKLSLLFEVSEKTPADEKTQIADIPPLGPLFSADKNRQEEIREAVKKARLRLDFTFDEFCVSTSNQLAFAAAQAVARNPGKNYNPFFIWGGVGVGKTHLMQAIGHEILTKNPRARVVYASGEQFTNEIIQGIRRHDTSDFKDKYRSADALLIDDIQFISGKDTAQEEFFHTFNAVQERDGQIIMTSDRKPKEIKDLADRLTSRFEGGLVADISTPDSELKTAICILKAKKRGVELSTKMGSLISNNINNIRTLDGAIQLLVSKAAAEHQEITENFIADTLKLTLMDNETPSRLDARKVLDEVCAYFEIAMKDIKGIKRDRPIAEPRQILMFLLKKHTAMTLDEIADFLGGRDHSTIIHGVRKIEKLASTNDRLKNQIKDLRIHLGLPT